MFEELGSFIFNEVPEDNHFCKLFPYTLPREASCWFKKLPPESLITRKDIMNAFLNNFLYDVAANLEIEIKSIMEYMNSADSTQKITDVSSCDLVPDVYIKITMEDFLELEDEAQPENLDQNLEKKLDNDQHTSQKDLETSPEASID
ncbi:hypothetical protein DY000_02007755 [Brassica cretica]|uniref:Retrotransposon gag domain-containing protein n=1 Tax=Brassica cretica TaxID=69181 RepID=A0ABQ7CBE4_BRACR|nr:hypothetical protein DY000_02007755 [Brassica cretica]